MLNAHRVGAVPAMEDNSLVRFKPGCRIGFGERFNNGKIVSTETRAMRGVGTK